MSLSKLSLRASLALAVVLGAVWVTPVAGAANLEVAPTGADSGDCRALPCRTLSYAYRQASAGEIVEFASGTYPSQSVPAVANRAAPPIEVRPAPSADVSFGALRINGSYVTVRDIATGDVDIEGGAGLVRGVSVINGRGRTMWIQSAQDLLIRGGSYGGNQNGPTVQIGAAPSSFDVTFDGVDFHDAVATNATVHMECLWAGGVQGLVVRNSLFRNCAYFDIFLTTLNGANPKNVLLESNVFEKTKQWNGQDAPYSVNVANWVTRMEGFKFRNNTFASDIAIQSPTIVDSSIVGNIGPLGSCTNGVTYRRNVWTSRRCGTTDKVAAGAMSQFVDPASHDWRLKAGAAAIDAADPDDAPSTDCSGFGRVRAPDAGACEYGAGPTTPAGNPPPTGSGSGSGSGSTAQPVALLADAAPLGPVPSISDKRVVAGVRLGRWAAPISRVRMSGTLVCARRTKACGVSTVRLRATLTRRAALTLRIERLRKVGSPRLVRTLRTRASVGAALLRVHGRGLARGRYRLTLASVDAAGSRSKSIRLPLRVR